MLQPRPIPPPQCQIGYGRTRRRRRRGTELAPLPARLALLGERPGALLCVVAAEDPAGDLALALPGLGLGPLARPADDLLRGREREWRVLDDRGGELAGRVERLPV